MKKSMQELLSKNKDKISEESAEKILKIDEAEIAGFLRKIGSQEIEYIPSGMIKKELSTEYIGKEIYSFKEVESTNSVAKFLAKQGSPEGTVVISETQTKGKGRRGKKWESPSGGVWLSIILKPDIDPSKASLITLATGVAVARTLRGMNIDARIKWPNDILINNKKVCGILTEANAKFNSVEYVIVGVGIDTNLNVDVLTEDVKNRATSLSVEAKIEIKESETIANFLNEFEEVYNLFKLEQFDDIMYDWRRMSQTIGSYVEIRQPLGKVLKGNAVGINNQGALILELTNGELKKVISGECNLKKN
ncbi:Bifunctional ligase/repressor BirA [bioreactor metagenome]|uniref:Bifunctional ligase/repressor BirA n=1 Tax=bioreactor metagenome TaxID=1076179 RepID=A0A644U9S6_9ZZZZ|nr:biotin--[acetyl-CoA-carboxylase] ligase [Methanobrevibacter sp.]MEA4956724.1 biotin--[acetyl-CoA-carboxylase] ligase [Methanobrevibacter sp.]